MNANYVEVCRVGNLEADFQRFPLVHFFLKISQYCCETSIIQIQQRKVKNIFLVKLSKNKNHLHMPDQFFAINLILG